MNATAKRPGRLGRIRDVLARLDAQLRLQREVLWHPRLGLVGARQPVPVRGLPRSRRR